MSFFRTQEEKERWIAHRKTTIRRPTNLGRETTFMRKRRAINLYLQFGSKGKVCDEMHMSRHTLNKILDAAGVAQ